jgi:SAM-dependent methyltransferase
MTKTYALTPSAERSTRECLDPWFFVLIDAARRVKPCCWHPPVTTLPPGASLDAALDGPEIRELRRQLLDGDLNTHCRECPQRRLIDPAGLRRILYREITRELGDPAIRRIWPAPRDPPPPAPRLDPQTQAKLRWRGDEPAEGLTWGRLMTGDTLWDLYLRTRRFGARDRLLEIGPGYGRLARTALERGVPFAAYTGLELSAARVGQLCLAFSDDRLRWLQGDIDDWESDDRFDVAIASSTFEHLYPDCRKALTNLRRHLAHGAFAFIDFLPIDGEGRQAFQADHFARLYPREELTRIFEECGYRVRAIETCTIGEGDAGPVERFVVIAQRGRGLA